LLEIRFSIHSFLAEGETGFPTRDVGISTPVLSRGHQARTSQSYVAGRRAHANGKRVAPIQAWLKVVQRLQCLRYFAKDQRQPEDNFETQFAIISQSTNICYYVDLSRYLASRAGRAVS
jgi:hypothetical protein